MREREGERSKSAPARRVETEALLTDQYHIRPERDLISLREKNLFD